MAKSLSGSIKEYSSNKGVLFVSDPKVGQRVIALSCKDNAWGYYQPCCATITKVHATTVSVSFYTSLEKPVRVDRRAIFRHDEAAPRWTATMHSEPYASVCLNGSRHCWIGEVYLGEKLTRYERMYPEIDYETGDLTLEQVWSDWQADPSSFVQEDDPFAKREA